MKGLYSGRQIKDLKGRSQRVTRSQTAAGAYAAITLKYGSVEDSAKYFHTGKGNWNKYSLQNDKKRTGKLAASIEEWRERPHKLDFKGIDTKDGVSGKKPRFSVTSLKPSAKLVGRKGKSQVKATSRAILKNVVKPKPIKAKHKEQVRHDNVEWDAFAQKLVVKKKPDKSLVRIPCKSERDAYIKGRELEKKGITNIEYKLLGGVWTVEYKRQKSTIKANHVYASFMRPLWIGFNPGVQYREIKVTDAHKDFRFNRKPHAVIVTSQPIPEDKIKSLELTDLIKGKKLAKEVKRIKGLSFLDDNMKESLISQVLAGKDKAVINKYIEKGKQLAEKKQKKQKFSVTSLKGSDKPTARKGKAVIQGTFSKAIDDWRVNKKIALTERRQKPVKKTVYEIYKNAGNGWKSVNVIIDNKLEADKLTKIQNEIEEKNKSGINFKVVPITSVTASHLPPNKYYTKLSLSALKGPAKIAGRKNKLQPKLNNKAVTKSTPKPTKQAKIDSSKDKQKINAISKDVWIRHKNAEARSAGLNVDPAEVTKVLNNLVKNVKISRSGSTIKVESAYPEYAHKAVRAALKSGYNDTTRLGAVKTISNKILYKGVTIVISTNKGLKVKPLMGEFKNYKYKITPETGTIEYILNGGRLKGYEDKFNINLEAMEDLKIKALKEIEDHIKSSNTYAHEPAKIMASKPAKKPRKPRTTKPKTTSPKKELSIEERYLANSVKAFKTANNELTQIRKTDGINSKKYEDKKSIVSFLRKNMLEQIEKTKKSKIAKRVKEEAGADWNNQCKMFMSGKVPFRDKTARACYDRHAKAAGL